MNLDDFSTVVAIWSGAWVLFGLGGALLGELSSATRHRQRPAPEVEPSDYKKAA